MVLASATRDRRNAYLMIISQQLIQKVDSIVANEPLVVGIDEGVPRFLWVTAEYVVVLGV